MADRLYHVLCLRTGNSARSIMGEAIMNRMGAGRFRAFSAGSHPKRAMHPNTWQVIGKKSCETSFTHSESRAAFEGHDAPEMDCVYTVCDDAAEETGPAWPGHPMTAHWGIPDPARATGSDARVTMAFYGAYRLLERRLSLLVNPPIGRVDRLALQHKLERIETIASGQAVADIA